MTTEEQWVGVDDVAAHLDVNKDSIYRWINNKGLPAHKVGRFFRFKLCTFQPPPASLFNRQRHGATSGKLSSAMLQSPSLSSSELKLK